MNKKVLIIVVAAALVAGGGTAAALLVLRGPAPADADVAPVEEDPGLVALDSFVVNLSNDDMDRYAKINLQLTVKPAALATEIETDRLLNARVRDRVLTMISSKGYEELVTPLGKEGLRREVKARLEPLFDEGEIVDVLFSEFVVQ